MTKHLIVLFCLALVALPSAFAQQSLEQRVSELEARVAQLEQVLSSPPLPGTTTEVEGFRFARVNYQQSSPSYLEVVGEISSIEPYEWVEVRVTAYAASGAILGTNTFPVEMVGATPRTFDTSIRNVEADEVTLIAWQIERAR